MLSRVAITPVTAFVDWNSQIHAAEPPRGASPIEVCETTLRYVGRALGKALNAAEATGRYDVTLRLYHGWYRGFEASERRKAMIQVFASTDFPSLSTRANVVIRPNLQFGDFLTSALPSRLHTRLNCHLPNTLRPQIIDKAKDEEKMVDSAIAGEVVDLAHREPDRWLVVIGNDDDLIPPVFIAEGALRNQSGRVILLRSRPDSPFLKLDGVRIKP
ncbi:hypothetical protein [Novosphingobium humi]|uniref:hypothetical protein n=1 Tax=Novosphingobium humi TaxID=2282397 RepID=UPI0025AEE23C|nr:hypothetical protein [Novosphingobium humi]WJS99028.1 hypothetical protein NYQ05_02410 [Novosphingobium humi]